MSTSFRLSGLVRVVFPLVAIALVVSPAFAQQNKKDKDDKKDKTEENAQTCRASFRGFEANIDRSNCKTCTARTGIDTITRCKLELMTPLREKLCTVAFSGNNRPESFDVPFQYGKTSSTMQIGCPGKR